LKVSYKNLVKQWTYQPNKASPQVVTGFSEIESVWILSLQYHLWNAKWRDKLF